MTDNKQKSGVYEILNTTNGKRYVGSAVSLRKRKRDHWSVLRRDAHRNAHLQNAWNKYGEDAFAFEVLECWEPEFLVSMEQWWMNMLCPEYNILPVAGSSLGMRHTDESRSNMSAAQKGRVFTEDHKSNLSTAQIGREHTAETKAKLSAAMKGNTHGLGYKHTKESLAKQSAAQMGRKFTDEHKRKISAKLLGNTNCLGRKLTDETKAKMSAWQKGRTLTKEHKANISAAKKRTAPNLNGLETRNRK